MKKVSRTYEIPGLININTPYNWPLTISHRQNPSQYSEEVANSLIGCTVDSLFYWEKVYRFGERWWLESIPLGSEILNATAVFPIWDMGEQEFTLQCYSPLIGYEVDTAEEYFNAFDDGTMFASWNITEWTYSVELSNNNDFNDLIQTRRSSATRWVWLCLKSNSETNNEKWIEHSQSYTLSVEYLPPPPWIISENTTISENLSVPGDIVIQNGATLTVANNVTLTFADSQSGANYGGRSTECEVVIQSGGTLNLGSSATLTSFGDWGGVYMLDGGDIDLTSGSTISNAIIGIHAFGAENINSPSQNANITNCSTGIRLSDSPANIQNIHFSGCSNSIDAIGIPVTSYIGSITIANGGIGLNSIAYAIPRLQLSEISSNMSSYAICLTQSGNLDIYQEANNIRYNGSTNTIYVSSSSPNISVEYNYWGSFPPPAATTIFNNTAKINNVQYFADYALDEPVPGAGKRAIQGQQAITDLFQQAKLFEKDFDYASAAEVYKEIHSRSTDIDSRTKSLRLMYGSLLHGGLPVNELKTSITAEIPSTTGKNAMILRYLLGDILLKEGRHQEAINHFIAFRDMYKGTSAEVDALVKLAVIYGNYLGDKESAQEYADLARNLNPGHASLPDAYSAAGIAYTALDSENKYLDFNDDFNALKPAEPHEQLDTTELKVSISPNPANPVTTLYYSITANERVKLDIYSLSGQKITTLIDGVMSAGSHSIQFDGSSYSSGMYFYMIQAGQNTKTGKFLILK